MAESNFEIVAERGRHATARRMLRMLALTTGCLMLLTDLALSDASIDPKSSEGKQKIEDGEVLGLLEKGLGCTLA